MNAINDARSRYAHGELWWYLPLVNALEVVQPGLAMVWADSSIRALLTLLPASGGSPGLAELDALAALRNEPPPTWDVIAGMARRIGRASPDTLSLAVAKLYEAFACRWYETAQRYHMAVGTPISILLEALPTPADGFALVCEVYVQVVTTYGVNAGLPIIGAVGARELHTA